MQGAFAGPGRMSLPSPSRDPHRLDGEDDGIACEALRY